MVIRALKIKISPDQITRNPFGFSSKCTKNNILLHFDKKNT